MPYERLNVTSDSDSAKKGFHGVMPTRWQETEKLGCYRERHKVNEKQASAEEERLECRRESKSSPFITTGYTYVSLKD